MIAHGDFETRSAVDLAKTGVHVYAEHPSTDVWCLAWAIGGEPAQVWTPDAPGDIARLHRHIRTGGLFMAHNCQFERAIWAGVMVLRYGWPALPLEQCRCTMAMAYALALPGSLKAACAALGLDMGGKDDAGRRLMLQMCRPKTDDARGSYTWWDEAEKRDRLYSVCAKDVDDERALEKRLLPLSAEEQKVWELDQRINDRGIAVDEALCHAAQGIVATVTDKVNAQMHKITDGAVGRITNNLELVKFCNARGVKTDSSDKETVSRLLARDDLPEDVRGALLLRQEGAKASVLKIQALLKGRSADGRARGMLQYHAASTGRWGGRRFQPQNLKRPEQKDVAETINTIMRGDADLLELMHGPPLAAVGDAIRGMVCAGPGTQMFASDLSNIEGRVLAWLAGEEWKLKAFRDFDAGIGADLYKVAYGRAFGVDPVRVDDKSRQIGKVMELALGYAGGVGAFQTMAKGYGVKIGDAYDIIAAQAGHNLDIATDSYLWRGKASGIDSRSWIAAEIVKLLWREAHPMVTQFWRDVERAAISACGSKHAVRVGAVAFLRRGSFLFARLPSGRALCYPYPQVRNVETKFLNRDGKPVFKETLTYKSVVNVANTAKIVDAPGNTSQWARITTYGGSLVENLTQAVARDVLVNSMLRHEDAGYPLVMTVHDENVAEREGGDAAEFVKLMAEVPAWAAGLPVAATGWAGHRYRK